MIAVAIAPPTKTNIEISIAALMTIILVVLVFEPAEAATVDQAVTDEYA